MKSQKKISKIINLIILIIFIGISAYLGYRYYHVDRGDTFFYLYMDTSNKSYRKMAIDHYYKALKVFPWDSRAKSNIKKLLRELDKKEAE